jgi:APA family basic amino acid/polyamine antiporter
MFLAVAPMSAMAGKVEVGFVVAGFAFGESGAKAVGIMLSVLLISTVSAMLLAGPRALQVMGQDFRLFAWLAKENKSGVPAIAVGLQLAITLAFILTSSFESIIIFSGTILALNSLLTVLGVLVLRVREPDLPRPFRIPWYPLPLIAYSVIVSWTLVYLVIERPEEVLWALILIGSGLLLYFVSAKLQPTQRS